MIGLKKKCSAFLAVMVFVVCIPKSSFADFWGGDDVILTQILAEALEQYMELESILGTGTDTIDFLKQINAGVSDAMSIMRTANSTLHPGTFFQYQGLDQMLSLVRQVYGMVPETPDQQLENLTDESVAESISLHNDAFTYADAIDPEAERIKDFSKEASPLGAARLTSESLGVLIHVNNQVLRTNAANLNIASENLALQNRREKLNSDQFKMQYEGLSDSFSHLPSMSATSDLSGTSP
jgi:hypothetical protein